MLLGELREFTLEGVEALALLVHDLGRGIAHEALLAELRLGAREFLLEGNKVKATMMYRGRQMAHLEFGKAVLDRLAAELADVGKVEMEAKLEGRNMTMVLAPK